MTNMWILWLILAFIVFKLYNKVSCGWCYSRTIMTGKVVIVTGANTGIGFETAFNLARRGAKVILACRDEKKGQQAAKEIISRTKNKNVFCKRLDLASLKSVRDFVKEFKKEEYKLDVLVNNAGMIGYGMDTTEDGIVTEMQVNHFGPFLLTVLLIPLLKKSDNGRVIMVSSIAHRNGNINFKTINETSKKSFNHSLKVYCDTKLCNLLFSNELARRVEGTGIAVNSLHPGVVRSSLYKNMDSLVESSANFIFTTFFKNVLEGAQTSIFLAVSDDVVDLSGKYFADCREAAMSRKAMDYETSAELWHYSEEIVKLRPEEVI